jgi:predicted transcriptional regulator
MGKANHMKTLKVGIATYDQFKARTIAIAKGEYKPQSDEPKIWFTSLESFAKLLSAKNRALLKLIAQTQPGSLQELAEKTGRAKSNLSRTLKTMERYGLVQFEEGHGRNLAPRVNYTDLVLDVPLQAL